MKKKGQILGVPLVLVFGLIVGALILAYGAKVIIDMMDEAEYVDFLGTLDDIENNVETFSHYDEGSSKVYDLDLPQDLETLCFYDTEQEFNCYHDGEDCDGDLAELVELLGDDDYNVYVIPQDLFERGRFGIEEFIPKGDNDDNPVCVSNGEQILFTTEDDTVSIAYYE